MIPDFKTYLRESIWSDMQDRGTGDAIKTEDKVDLDSLSYDGLYEYLNKRYKLTNPDFFIEKVNLKDESYGDFLSLTVPLFSYISKNENKYSFLSLYYNFDKNVYFDEIEDDQWYGIDKNVNISVNDIVDFETLCPNFVKDLDQKFDLVDVSDTESNPQLYEVMISPKNKNEGMVTHFINVIEYIIHNVNGNKITKLITR